jgi:hypothetical protein
MKTTQVLRQRQWTEAELRASKLKYYAPRKQRVMARVLNIPTEVQATIEILAADKGDVMIYDPDTATRKANIDAYDHWPVNRELFRKTYKPWDDVTWQPSEAEAHLIAHGCRPFYKHTGVWALRLTHSVPIQSLESKEPVQVPPGRWLIIGSHGEPYHMSDDKFRSRYLITDHHKAKT